MAKQNEFEAMTFESGEVGGLAALASFIKHEVRGGAALTNVDETRHRRLVLVDKGVGEPELMSFLQEPLAAHHSITQLDSYVQAVRDWRREECPVYTETPAADVAASEARAVTWVKPARVDTVLWYGTVHDHSLTLPLRLHPARAALDQLIKPGARWSQQALWELLNGDLWTGMDPALQMSVSGISVSGKRDTDISIDEFGQASGSAGISYKVNFRKGGSDPQSGTIRKEWVYDGPWFDCVDNKYKITLVLMLDADDEKGLQFRFIARGLQEVRDAVYADLRARLTLELAGVASVYVAE
ncbi:MAG: hypothetical protein HYV27_15150 [Candidatus Hydrogenedentes bacterium]|nr:hypothetical protein [Candidatus Hydrogenedentota bacterium]